MIWLLYPLIGALLFAGIVWQQMGVRDIECGEFAWCLVAVMLAWPLVALLLLLDQIESYRDWGGRVFIKRRRG